MDVADGGEVIEEYPADTSRLAPVGDLSKPEHRRSEPATSTMSVDCVRRSIYPPTSSKQGNTPYGAHLRPA